MRDVPESKTQIGAGEEEIRERERERDLLLTMIASRGIFQ